MFLLKLTDSLNAVKVKYALVGGYALALHGVVRGTVDIDIVIMLTQDSFKKAEAALNKIGLTSSLPISANEVFQFRKEYIKNRNLIAWSFYDPTQPSRLVDIIITEDLAKLRTTLKKVGNKKVNVVSIPDLIKMKTKSAREQDKEDIRALKILWKKK